MSAAPPSTIVLDTDVLSELLRPLPAPNVMQWMAAQPQRQLRVTTVTHAEMLYGAHLLRDQRREPLLSTIHGLFAGFADRSLVFDPAAAQAYAEIAALRCSIGRPMSHFDAQIAAITRVAGAMLATRNVGDFDDCGLTIINPWQA